MNCFSRLLVSFGVVGAMALAAPSSASASAAYGPCTPTSVQLIWNGATLRIECSAPIWYYWSDGVLSSATQLEINSSSPHFASYTAMATAALLSGKTLWIWPNFGASRDATTVTFQDLKIQ